MNGIKIAVVVMFFTLWTSSVLAVSPQSGIIYFRGSIVESPCDINVQQNQVRTSCWRDGQDQVTVTSLKGEPVVPDNIGQTDVRWLDHEHKQGIMTVSYN